MLRREFLLAAAAPAVLRGASLSSTDRVNRVLRGGSVDRPPFTLWHHFGLKTAEAHAARTIDFHRLCRTDIVKVMSDFPYPKPPGKWWELKVERNPFPQQIKALEMIAKTLAGKAYFLETIFNPMNVAVKLSSKEGVRALLGERPQTLLDALEIITQSEINHARSALEAGASGIFLAVDNANAANLTPEEYRQFSGPFDRRILDAVKGARMNVLHLHTESAYLAEFRAWPVQVVNYSREVSKIPFPSMRRTFPSAVLMGGLDETKWSSLSSVQMRAQWRSAARAAGRRFILSPGCSVPDNSTEADLKKLLALVRT
jgi:uroporphyrinogen-III decarboxylase